MEWSGENSYEGLKLWLNSQTTPELPTTSPSSSSNSFFSFCWLLKSKISSKLKESSLSLSFSLCFWIPAFSFLELRFWISFSVIWKRKTKVKRRKRIEFRNGYIDTYIYLGFGIAEFDLVNGALDGWTWGSEEFELELIGQRDWSMNEVPGVWRNGNGGTKTTTDLIGFGFCFCSADSTD